MKHASLFLLKFVRALIVLLLGMSLIWNLELSIFGEEKAERYLWLLYGANFVLLCVLYRNWVQFTGWKALQGTTKLSRPATVVLLAIAFFIVGGVAIL